MVEPPLMEAMTADGVPNVTEEGLSSNWNNITYDGAWSDYTLAWIQPGL
jgi:hypothetical protein